MSKLVSDPEVSLIGSLAACSDIQRPAWKMPVRHDAWWNDETSSHMCSLLSSFSWEWRPVETFAHRSCFM